MTNRLLWILMALGLLLMACSGSKEGLSDPSTAGDSEKHHPKKVSGVQAMQTINVKTQKVGTGALTESALAHGVTKAEHQVVYSAEVAGKLEYMGFELGDKVKKGAVLARIDFKTLKAQANQAQSNYDLAKATYDRVSKLREEELISRQKFDESLSSLVSAKAGLAIAQANLNKAVVKAYHQGIVSRKFAEKAEFVGPGTPLYEVVDYRTIVVEAQLAESQVAQVQTDATVKVIIDALGDEFDGAVDTILPTADAVSKTFTVRVKIDNPDLKILVGMSALLDIKAETLTDVVVVPQNTILEEPGGVRAVFVANGKLAEKRLVHIGAREGDKVVVTDGLKPTDELIVVGHRSLVDGQPIHRM